MSEEDFTGLVAVGSLEGSDKFRKMLIWWEWGLLRVGYEFSFSML